MMKNRFFGVILLVLMMGLLAGCGSKGDEANKRGLEYYANGQYEAAAEAFSEAIAKDNAVTEFYLNRVMALIKLERYQDAATSLSYAQHLEPDTTEVARAKGILYYAQGQYQSALDSFKTAVANNSGKAGEMVIDILRYTAACQMELLQYADAISTYDRLIDAGNKTAENYFQRGVAYLKSGKATEAGMDFNRVVESGKYEDYWRIYLLLVENGQKEMGEQFLTKAVMLEDDSDSAHVWRGEFHYYLGSYDEALAEFNAASKNVIDVDIYMMIANIYKEKGDINRMKAAFSMAESRDPKHPSLLRQKTLFEMECENYDEAYAVIELAMTLEENPYAQDMLYCQASCLEYLGRFEEALAAFEKYIGLYGSNEEIDHEIEFLKTRIEKAE